MPHPPTPKEQVQASQDAAAPLNNHANAENTATDIITRPEITSKPEAYTLKRNETLIGLLSRAGIKSREAHRLVNALDDVANLRKLRPGQQIRLQRNGTREIEKAWMRDTFDSEAIVERIEGQFSADRQPIKTLALTHLVSGEITDNLYLSAKRAGLPDKVIVNLIRMMSFNVDFEREIRVGDSFEVYFERRYAPSVNETQEGRILHVSLGLRKGPIEATWFDSDGKGGDYFDAKGQSTRRALMKTPLDVAVVTDSYGSRKHPVLGYTRMHKGVDFRAPTGTPIMAAGDGVIEKAARYGSFGNYIRIRHNDTYKTAYAHLSRYGKAVKKGRRVKQGQIIGYSGATGRVTGAHLHYEVLVSGRQVNPLRLKLPSGIKLKGDSLQAFDTLRGEVLADVSNIQERDKMLAQFNRGVTAAQ
jgi:murein DD-endopeptidase MepM/ murein hydrolase activator NlpD